MVINQQQQSLEGEQNGCSSVNMHLRMNIHLTGRLTALNTGIQRGRQGLLIYMHACMHVL
jgi:hypothetical protein